MAFGGVPSPSSKQSFRIPSSRAAHAWRCAVMSFGKTMWHSSSTTLEPQWKQLQAFYCSSQHWPETGNEFSNPLRGEVDLGVDGLNGATSPWYRLMSLLVLAQSGRESAFKVSQRKISFRVNFAYRREHQHRVS